MKALIQRVKRASVTVDGVKISEISKGILIFLGVEKDDEKENAEKLADKIVKQAHQLEIETPKLFVPLELRHLLFTLLSNYMNNIIVLAREEVGCNAQIEISAEI